MCLILQLVWFIVSLREMFCGDYNDTISCGVVFFKLNAFLPSESSCEMLGIVPHSALIGCYDVECLHHILLPRPFAPFIEASNNVDGGTIVNIVLWIKTRSKKIFRIIFSLYCVSDVTIITGHTQLYRFALYPIYMGMLDGHDL